MTITEQDVPLIATVAATLLAGRISDMYDPEVCVSDAVYMAECIVLRAKRSPVHHAELHRHRVTVPPFVDQSVRYSPAIPVMVS